MTAAHMRDAASSGARSGVGNRPRRKPSENAVRQGVRQQRLRGGRLHARAGADLRDKASDQGE